LHIRPSEGYASMSVGNRNDRGTDITLRQAGSFLVMAINGPLASRSVADKLCAEVHHMLDAGGKNLVLDLAGTPMADSAGIGALVAVRTLIQWAGGKLVIYSAQRRVRESLKRMRLDPFFTFSDDPTLSFAKE
jgi:anti-sigma B factor antagonist